MADGSGMVNVGLDCAAFPTILWRPEVTASVGWEAQLETLDGNLVSRQDYMACGPHGEIGPLVVRFHPDDNAAHVDDEWLIIQLSLVESNGPDRAFSLRIVFRQELGEFALSSYAEYMASQVQQSEGAAALPVAFAQTAPPELAGLPPWDNPLFSDQKREEWAALYGPQADEREEAAFALTAARPETAPSATTAPDDLQDTGCTMGQGRGRSSLLLLSILLIGSALLLRRRIRQVSALWLIVLSGPLAFPQPVKAVEGCIYGFYSFWDIRGYSNLGKASDAPGSRVRTCDPADTTCLPGDEDCCFKGLPRTRVLLKRACQGEPAYTISENMTDDDGAYIVCDQDWRTDCYYSVQLWFERMSGNVWPLKAKAQTWDTGFSYYAGSSWFYMPSQYYYLPNLSVNQAGDTTSPGGDVSTGWRTVYEAAMALTAEGEERYRRSFGSPNAYDTVFIRYPGPNDYSSASCSASEIWLTSSDYARAGGPAEELGHLAHGRVVGCVAGLPVFPEYRAGAHSWQTSESNALGESIAQLVKLLTWWDPDVAETFDIFPDFAACALDIPPETIYNNSNYASADRNNYLAFWEFIDTATTNNWYPGIDSVDVTMVELYDALVALQNRHSDECLLDADCNVRTGEVCRYPVPSEGTTKRCHGGNTYKEERYHITLTRTCGVPAVPLNSEACNSGEVCDDSGFCVTGDPHGGNIRDWVYILGLNEGISEPSIMSTLNSSPCMQGEDNTASFVRGYRSN